ncbi:MAG: 6-bladed beta-propeller [Acidobacteriota bacterium]
MRRSLLATLVAVVTLGPAGCGDDTPISEADDATDLAVRVDTTDGTVRVHNQGTPPAWELRLETEIGEVGGSDAASPAEFGRVASVALAPDGRILVADQQADEIRVFEADGSFLEAWGRSGEGPGEFGSLYSLGWVGDTLAVLDPGVGRIGLFDPEGRLVGSASAPDRAEEVAPFIGEERMALVTRDELGVERVEVYRIERPE